MGQNETKSDLDSAGKNLIRKDWYKNCLEHVSLAQSAHSLIRKSKKNSIFWSNWMIQLKLKKWNLKCGFNRWQESQVSRLISPPSYQDSRYWTSVNTVDASHSDPISPTYFSLSYSFQYYVLFLFTYYFISLHYVCVYLLTWSKLNATSGVACFAIHHWSAI